MRLTGSRIRVIVSPPYRRTTNPRLHIVDWRFGSRALCGVALPFFGDVPYDQRPFAEPGTATCRKCRHIVRHSKLPADLLEAARRPAPQAGRARRTRPQPEVTGQLALPFAFEPEQPALPAGWTVLPAGRS